MAFQSFTEAAIKLSQQDPGDAVDTLANHPLLNGSPYKAFRHSIDLEERRRDGTFFSSPEISAKLASALRERLSIEALVMDPTCGIGDLLLAYAAKLPLSPTLEATLRDWGRCLAGLDLRADLVRMTKARLLLLARARGRFSDPINDVEAHFPLIRQGDALLEAERLRTADGFLFNPPFGQVRPTENPLWAAGQINAAAIFLAHILEHRKPTGVIAAVLPEVLRCGSRYKRFRAHVAGTSRASTFESLGRFDVWTDVDVFWTLLLPGQAKEVWKAEVASPENVVGDRFIIRVGTVVPHRHAETGPSHPFLCAKTTPAWAERFRAETARRFEGTVFKPPFVVIRRTSSPSDKIRTVGSIVVGKEAVAVENHLIVARPKSGGIAECEALLSLLKLPATSAHLNEVLRCRHLTTVAVSALPWRTADV